MKKFLLFSAVLFSKFIFSQVGINTKTPKADLDVNGSVRVSKLDELVNSPKYLLTIDEQNIIKKTKALYGALEKKVVKVNTFEFGEVVNEGNFNIGNIIITSIDGCGNTMISNFTFYKMTLFFNSGFTGDNKADNSIKNHGSSSSNSSEWIVQFTKKMYCGQDKDPYKRGFNFDFVKTGANKYRIYNPSWEDATYTIYFQKID